MSILSINISPNPVNTQQQITIQVVPETFTYARWSQSTYEELTAKTYHEMSGVNLGDGTNEDLEQFSESVLEGYTHAELGGE